MFEHGLNFSWFCMFFVTKSNSIFFFFFFLWLLFFILLYCSWCCGVWRPYKFFPYIIMVQVIFYFLWDHWAHPDYFENRIPLRGRIQPRKLQYCIWRDSIKPSLRFSWLFVFFVSKGNHFLLFFYCPFLVGCYCYDHLCLHLYLEDVAEVFLIGTLDQPPD